jgi:hypothetical protein
MFHNSLRLFPATCGGELQLLHEKLTGRIYERVDKKCNFMSFNVTVIFK